MKTYRIFIGEHYITTVQALDSESALDRWAEFEGVESFVEMGINKETVEIYEC
jgi:hypothetical protein